MGQDWITDVLADGRSFARQNEMPLLCAQLDEAMLAAAVEVAARCHYPGFMVGGRPRTARCR
ncbi:MAG: hypothetical protein ACJAVT_000153 [Yoonia sp.]|jgi:hypothetical protein